VASDKSPGKVEKKCYILLHFSVALKYVAFTPPRFMLQAQAGLTTDQLMEKGSNIRYIRDLSGHYRLETTAVYVPVNKNNLQNTSSHLDRIFEDMKLNNKELNRGLT